MSIEASDTRFQPLDPIESMTLSVEYGAHRGLKIMVPVALGAAASVGASEIVQHEGFQTTREYLSQKHHIKQLKDGLNNLQSVQKELPTLLPNSGPLSGASSAEQALRNQITAETKALPKDHHTTLYNLAEGGAEVGAFVTVAVAAYAFWRHKLRRAEAKVDHNRKAPLY